MSSEHTEQATPQRRKKARDQGDIVRSRELLSAAGMLAGLMALGAAANVFVNYWRQCYIRTLAQAGQTNSAVWGVRELTTLVRTALLPAVLPASAVMGAAFAAVLVLGVAQGGGFTLRPQSLAPKLDRINPGSYIKQMFSLRTVVRLAKSLLPAFVVAYFGWAALQKMLLTLPVMSLVRLPETFGAAYGLGIKTAWVMAAWAALDYLVEWRSWNQRLKMSKQEIREEIKEAMGNAQVKGKIRSMQRTMARRKAKVDMRRAAVVITNPTHYAVALEFSLDTMSAPMVLIKGRDLLALDIREEARQAGVPLVENPPLARSLYRSVEAGHVIPYELYAAVAGILAFLFREQQEQAARNQRRAQQARQEQQQTSNLRAHVAGFDGGM